MSSSSGWQQTYDSVFFITIAGLVFGACGLCIKTCYRCKIEELSICQGFLQIRRDIQSETRVDEVVVGVGGGGGTPSSRSSSNPARGIGDNII
jgi:hypothetical protein